MVDEEREAVLLSGGRKELSLSRFGSCIGEPLYGRPDGRGGCDGFRPMGIQDPCWLEGQCTWAFGV